MPEFESLDYDGLDALGGGPPEYVIQDYYNEPEHLRALRDEPDGTELEAPVLTDEQLAGLDAEYEQFLLQREALAQMQGEAEAMAEWMDQRDPGDHRYDGPED